MRTAFLLVAIACSSPTTRETSGPGPAPTPPPPPDPQVIAGPVLRTPAPDALVAAADCPAGKGKTYEVGEGKPYTSLGAVPFERLGAGDRVLVHHRAEPYREKIHLSSRGTEKDPIRICGVPGADGSLPVISGENATTRKEAVYPYPPTQERGLMIVTPREGYRWGDKPGWIAIQNLELRGAYRGTDDRNPRGFTDGKGEARAYSTNAAAIFVERGEHIAIRNCVLTDSSYGLFVASADTEEVVSRDILVEGSWIHGNGTSGTDRRHNVYTEAIGVVLQGNRFGPQREGARGNQIKDRSAGTIVRYNWIEGGAHLLDLVEPEESYPMTGKAAGFRDTYVYGNVLVSGEDDGSSLIHYGGDNGKTETYRKGTLHFFHNTVVIRADEKKRWNTTLFRVETDDETVDARNNVIWRGGTTHLTLMKQAGKATFGVNWISDGYAPWQYADRKTGSIAGEEKLIVGKDPGFVDLAGGDLRPGARSPAIGAGGALADGLPADHAVTRQYRPHRAVAARDRAGQGAALGAFEP